MINTFKALSNYELSKCYFEVNIVNGATNEEKL